MCCKQKVYLVVNLRRNVSHLRHLGTARAQSWVFTKKIKTSSLTVARHEMALHLKQTIPDPGADPWNGTTLDTNYTRPWGRSNGRGGGGGVVERLQPHYENLKIQKMLHFKIYICNIFWGSQPPPAPPGNPGSTYKSVRTWQLRATYVSCRHTRNIMYRLNIL